MTVGGKRYPLILQLLLSIACWQLVVVSAQGGNNAGPLIEEQLAVWPDEDYDDLSDAIPFDEDLVPLQPVVPTTTTTTTTTTTRKPVHWFNTVTSSTPKPKPKPWPQQPPSTEANVHIVHEAHVQHANGTQEDKLLLSNGVVNYKRTYHKLVAGQWVPVQEGYSAVPVRGQHGKYHTQFYVADELGNRAYKVTHGGRRPQLQHYWHYKAQKQTSKHNNAHNQYNLLAHLRTE